MRSTLRKGAVTILGASAILSLALGGTAAADPHRQNDHGLPLTALDGGFLPDSNDLLTTGSDTTQYVINSAAQDYSFENTDVRWASYNAFVPGSESAPVTGDQIVVNDPDQFVNAGDEPEANGDETTITRPNGSSAGITALINNPVLDVARSSRFRGTNAAEQNLWFIPALTDGLSYVVGKNAGADIRNLDAGELAAIYRCTDTRGYQPKLPQAGSGTRQFFLQQIGVAENEVGPCVDQTVQEHAAGPVVGNANAIAPMSTARFVNNPADPNNPPSAVVDIAATQATTGVFYVERTVYNVVRKADYTSGSTIESVFGEDGWLCSRFATDGVARQGFKVAANCGALL